MPARARPRLLVLASVPDVVGGRVMEVLASRGVPPTTARVRVALDDLARDVGSGEGGLSDEAVAELPAVAAWHARAIGPTLGSILDSIADSGVTVATIVAWDDPTVVSAASSRSARVLALARWEMAVRGVLAALDGRPCLLLPSGSGEDVRAAVAVHLERLLEPTAAGAGALGTVPPEPAARTISAPPPLDAGTALDDAGTALDDAVVLRTQQALARALRELGGAHASLPVTSLPSPCPWTAAVWDAERRARGAADDAADAWCQAGVRARPVAQTLVGSWRSRSRVSRRTVGESVTAGRGSAHRAGPDSVALVVHSLPPAEMSGSPLAAYGYARALGEAGWQVTVLSSMPGAPPWERARPSHDPSEPFERVVVPPDYGAGRSWLDAWSVSRTPARGHSGAVSAAVARVLERLAPSVVHIVDNVLLPLCIAEVAHEMGIPVVRGVSCAEDLCALVVPVSPCSGPAGYCEPPLTVDHCADCVSSATTDALLQGFRATGETEGDARRRAHLRELLAAQRARATHQFRSVYDRVVFASEQFRTYFEQTLPLDPRRTRVVPMGVDVPELGRSDGGGDVGSAAGQRRRGRGSDPLTFLVAGNTNPFKGTGALVAAFTHEALAARGDWRLLLAGGGNRELYGVLLGDPRVRDLGPYDGRGLPALLSAADVGVSASIFETFHRVTREYLAAGLPVVGSMAFGISDVVVDGGNGLLFDHADGVGLRKPLVRLLDDRALLDRLRAGAAATTVRSVAEEVAELVSIYDEVVVERSARR